MRFKACVSAAYFSWGVSATARLRTRENTNANAISLAGKVP